MNLYRAEIKTQLENFHRSRFCDNATMCGGAIVEQERFRFNGPNNAALISPATTKEQFIYFLKR